MWAGSHPPMVPGVGKQGLPCWMGHVAILWSLFSGWWKEGWIPAPFTSHFTYMLCPALTAVLVWNLRWSQGHHHPLLPQPSSLLIPVSPASCRKSFDNHRLIANDLSAQRVRQTLVTVWMALGKLLNSLRSGFLRCQKGWLWCLPHRGAVTV